MSIFGIRIDISLVYFVYGLAFYSMGLIMLREARRAPLFAEARVLMPLAIFGFVHGAHEWLEMVLMKAAFFGIQDPQGLNWLRLVLLIASFTSLITYAIRVLQPQRNFWPRGFVIGISWLLAYILLVFIGINLDRSGYSGFTTHADVLARYSLAFPGALLAALALNQQSKQARVQNRGRLSNALMGAGLGFALYSLTQLFVPHIDLFPASIFNTASFLAFTGIPIQAIRAGVAILMVICLTEATQVVETERQNELQAAQQSRLEALEQIRMDLIEREQLRRELLRHTVIAQEDERARIARELHDESAQTLTAFTLNLAALKKYLPKNGEAPELVDRLQDLSRQMSQGFFRMVHDLRPAQLDDLGLVAGLQYLVDQEIRSGLPVKLEIQGESQRLDPLIETVIFRIAQEALANVKRHSKTANGAQVCLAFSPEQIVFNVLDDGVGFDVDEKLSPPRGWGLAGMRERAEAVGGRFQIFSTPGKGVKVEVIIPANPMEPPSGVEEKAYERNSIDAG